MNEFCFAEIEEGMTQSFTRKITKEMEDMFRIVSGDDNPLHRDDSYAKEAGGGRFREHITFGMLTASLYSAMAGMYLPGKYALIHSLDIKFQKPVYAGDMLTVTGTVEQKYEGLNILRLKVWITNQKDICVSKADMKVIVLK